MRSSRSFSGPTKERPFYKLEEIEEICDAELIKLNLMPENPEPIRIDWFVEKRFKTTPQYERLPDGILGFTKFGANGVENIVVDSKLDEEGTVVSERRVRTTLAHEAGHGLLHAYLFVVGVKTKKLFDDSHDDTLRVLCRDIKGVESNTKYNGQWWEYQANRAMAALLLPRILVGKAIVPYLVSRGVFGIMALDQNKKDEAISALSDIFNVNPVVVKFRLEEMYPLTDSQQGCL
ncbi:MAG: hypothetical protein WCQ00_03015 [bacterium]